MDIYHLRLVSTADPGWLMVEHRGRVAVDSNHVALDGQRLEIVNRQRAGRTRAVTLESGTLLDVWQHSNGTFIGARAEDVDYARAAKAARDEEAKAALHEREKRLRNQAVEFNASLVIPVRWVPGAIVDDPRNNVSDNDVHVLLKQAIRDGRLMRAAGDLLCTRLTPAGGERVSARKLDEYTKVSCSACLIVAKRWQNE